MQIPKASQIVINVNLNSPSHRGQELRKEHHWGHGHHHGHHHGHRLGHHHGHHKGFSVEEKLSWINEKEKRISERLMNEKMNQWRRERLEVRLQHLKEKKEQISCEKEHHGEARHWRGRGGNWKAEWEKKSAEEKVRCLEEKKERISKKLASPEVDERTKERLQKRLQCVNARMERMKSAAVCSEKTNKPAVKQTPQEREEKKARRAEILKLEKQLLEKKLENFLASQTSSDSDDESNGRVDRMRQRLCTIQEKINQLSK